jgi:hypothetical protein
MSTEYPKVAEKMSANESEETFVVPLKSMDFGDFNIDNSLQLTEIESQNRDE